MAAVILPAGITEKTAATVMDYEERRHSADTAAAISPGAYVERNVVLAIGGYDGKQAVGNVEVLDTLTARWEAGPPMITARRGHGLCVLGTHVFAAGGYAEGCLDSLEVLDLRTGWWQQGPPMPTARYDLALAALSGYIYAVGGRGGGDLLDVTEMFDPKGWQWHSGPSLLRARAGIGATACNGRLYALGGEVRSEPNALEAVRDVEFLDECTGEGWAAAPAMVVRRCDVGVSSISGRLFAMGGYGGRHAPKDGSYLESVEYLDIASESGWVLGPSMHRARSSLGVTALAGTIYVMGGAFAGIGTTTTEVLDAEGPLTEWKMGPAVPGVQRWGMRLVSFDGLKATAKLMEEDRRVLARCKLMREICLHDAFELEKAVTEGKAAGLDPRELQVAEVMLAKNARYGFMTGALVELDKLK